METLRHQSIEVSKGRLSNHGCSSAWLWMACWENVSILMLLLKTGEQTHSVPLLHTCPSQSPRWTPGAHCKSLPGFLCFLERGDSFFCHQANLSILSIFWSVLAGHLGPIWNLSLSLYWVTARATLYRQLP